MATKVDYGEVSSPWPECRVFVGGCVERGVGSSFRKQAHAHCHKDDPYLGWVCVRSASRVLTDSGKPTVLMFHEYAHILTGDGHTARWAECLTKLGHPAEAKRCRDRITKRHRHSWTHLRTDIKDDYETQHYRCESCDMHKMEQKETLQNLWHRKVMAYGD